MEYFINYVVFHAIITNQTLHFRFLSYICKSVNRKASSMKVLNPIYDTVFKFLMEDIDVAKGLISLIIEEEVVELIPAPQEQTSTELKIKYSQLPLQRLDYVAIIKTITKSGTEQYHKVSIEVQKSPFIPELGRFRKYVSEKYARKSKYKTRDGVENDYLPIITIYFVDKSFNRIIPPVLRRKGMYWDVLNKQKFDGAKDQYVELLAHDSWFIQIDNLPPDLKNELLYCLSVFAPWFRNVENQRFIEIPEDHDGLEKYALLTKIVRRLQLAGKNREVETALELEISLESYIEKMEQDRITAQKREEEAKKREEEAKKREEEAKKRETETRKKVIESAKEMKKHNISIEIISKTTGLPKDEIVKL